MILWYIVLVFRKEKSSSKSGLCDKHFGSQYNRNDGQLMDNECADDSRVSLVTEDDKGSLEYIFATADVESNNECFKAQYHSSHSPSESDAEKSDRECDMSVYTNVLDALDNQINFGRIEKIKNTLSRIYDEQLCEIMTMLQERKVEYQKTLDSSSDPGVAAPLADSKHLLHVHTPPQSKNALVRNECATNHTSQHSSTVGKEDDLYLHRKSCLEKTNISSLTILARTLNKNYGVGTF